MLKLGSYGRTVAAAGVSLIVAASALAVALVIDAEKQPEIIDGWLVVSALVSPMVGGLILSRTHFGQALLVGAGGYAGSLAARWGLVLFEEISTSSGGEPLWAIGWTFLSPAGVFVYALLAYLTAWLGQRLTPERIADPQDASKSPTA